MLSEALKARVARAVRELIVTCLVIGLHDRAVEENRAAAILIAREVLPRVLGARNALERLEGDEHVVRAVSELSTACRLLREVAYGESADPAVVEAVSSGLVSLPLLLDDAHHHIHNAISALRKSRAVCREAREALRMLEEARRATSPTELYKRAYELIRRAGSPRDLPPQLD
ncbi:MAG: hypothetical protein DRJ56_04440 [Thermoprotei archaeon]|nr:MAG: hypothetical protein DRJ56_04440 [Thermoprotei archaeon]